MRQRLMSPMGLMAIMIIGAYTEAFIASSPMRYGGNLISGSTQSKPGSPFPSTWCTLPHTARRRGETAAYWRKGLFENLDGDIGDGVVLDEEPQALSSRDYEPASITRRVSEASRDVAGGAIAASFPVILLAMGGFPETAAADTPAWVGPTKLILDPILLYFEVAFIARIVLSWYPTLDLNKIPQNLVAWPTEPILKPTRAVVPPAFGVDITPIVWVMICSFLHEILLGQQGILNLISNK